MEAQFKKITKFVFRTFALFALVFFLAGGILGVQTLLAQTNKGQTYTVCVKDCDFTSIQKAIDESSAGDIIRIKGGLYNEEVQIKKDVTLQAYERQDEIQGSLFFAGPSLTVPQITTVHISKIIPIERDAFPESNGRTKAEETGAGVSQEQENDKISTIRTPLFDVSIQSRTEDRTSRDIIITLLVFLIVVLIIVGYFVFGYVIHKKDEISSKSSRK